MRLGGASGLRYSYSTINTELAQTHRLMASVWDTKLSFWQICDSDNLRDKNMENSQIHRFTANRFANLGHPNQGQPCVSGLIYFCLETV